MVYRNVGMFPSDGQRKLLSCVVRMVSFCPFGASPLYVMFMQLKSACCSTKGSSRVFIPKLPIGCNGFPEGLTVPVGGRALLLDS